MKKKVTFLIIVIVAFIILLNSIPMGRKHDGALRIASVNLELNNQNSSDDIIKLIDLECDIILCLEWSPINRNTALFQAHGYRAVLDDPRHGTHGSAVFAKKGVPISAGTVESGVSSPCSMPYVEMTVQDSQNNISLLGVHTPPPISACKKTTDPSIKAAFDYNADILLGDFNAFSWNREIQTRKQNGWKDARWKAIPLTCNGTWSPVSLIPKMIRIDYIFVKDEFKVRKFHTVSLSGSDHNAVVADISF